MNRHFTSFYCEHCGQLRRFTKRCADHPRHFIATVLTGGLWGIAWWSLYREEKRRPWKCCMCGIQQTPREEPPEAREARALRTRRRTVSMATLPPPRVY